MRSQVIGRVGALLGDIVGAFEGAKEGEFVGDDVGNPQNAWIVISPYWSSRNGARSNRESSRTISP